MHTELAESQRRCGSLMISDASDLADLKWPGRELAAGVGRGVDRLVEVLDMNVAEPVRRRRTRHRAPKAAVGLAAGRDHRVVDLAGPEDFGAPAQQPRIEVLRLRWLWGDLLVPNEPSGPGCDFVHC